MGKGICWQELILLRVLLRRAVFRRCGLTGNESRLEGIKAIGL
jgi:hypothetical protein